MGQKAIEAGPLSLRIAQIIRERKEEVAISDYVLADMSGIPRQRLRRAMVGDRPFLVDDLEAVATALGLIPWQVMREAERSLEEQADERSKPADNVVDFPRAQEENLPDFTKLAARKVTNRPEWDAIQALNDIGEESQDPGDYE